MTRQTRVRQFGLFVLALVIALGLFTPQFARAGDGVLNPQSPYVSVARDRDLSIYTLATPTALPSPGRVRPDVIQVNEAGKYLDLLRVTNLNVWTEYAPATRDLTGDCYSRTRGECVNALTVNINFETQEASTPIVTLGIGAPVDGAFPVTAPTVTLAATTQATKYHQIVLYPANDAYRLFQPGPVTCTTNDPPRCAPAASPNHWDAAYMLIRYDMPSRPNAPALDFKLY